MLERGHCFTHLLCNLNQDTQRGKIHQDTQRGWKGTEKGHLSEGLSAKSRYYSVGHGGTEPKMYLSEKCFGTNIRI